MPETSPPKKDREAASSGRIDNAMITAPCSVQFRQAHGMAEAT